MKNTNEIRQFALSNKDVLLPYFYKNKRKVPENTKDFQYHEVNALTFLSIQTPVELSKFLSIPIDELEELINSPKYRHYAIKKKKGGERQVFEPSLRLKKIQKKLNYFLQAYYLWVKPKQVHGFVINPIYLEKQCNIVENARPHVGKKHVLNLDLKDFFPNITAKQVKQVFTSHFFELNQQVANALTLLTTYNGFLPAGAPTSPVISNFVCDQLDADLIRFAETNGIAYTRYADDLTFSSNNKITPELVNAIKNIISQNHFLVNEKKIYQKTSNRKQTVTGITVNQKVNVDRKLLKKIRAMLHDLLTNGLDVATKNHFNFSGVFDIKYRQTFINRLEGYINFVGQVRGTTDLKYCLWKEQFDDFFYIDAKSEFYEDKANIGFFMGEINDDFNSKMIGFNDDFDDSPF
jgi:RNA-directed DNA polymerase